MFLHFFTLNLISYFFWVKNLNLFYSYSYFGVDPGNTIFFHLQRNFSSSKASTVTFPCSKKEKSKELGAKWEKEHNGCGPPIRNS